jgi:hypothetical protein
VDFRGIEEKMAQVKPEKTKKKVKIDKLVDMFLDSQDCGPGKGQA